MASQSPEILTLDGQVLTSGEGVLHAPVAREDGRQEDSNALSADP